MDLSTSASTNRRQTGTSSREQVISPAFTGNYEIKRDARGRIAIPAKLQYGFDGQDFVMLGRSPRQKALELLSEPVFEGIVSALRQASQQGNLEAKHYLDYFTAFYQRERVQGKAKRVEVAAGLEEYAQFGERVVLAGRDDRIMVMSEAAWELHQKRLQSIVDETAATSRWT